MTKFFNKFKKPFLAIFVPFSQFFGQEIFFRTTSYGFLASCQDFEKTNDTIPRKPPDRRKDGRTDGQKDGSTNRPYFIEPFCLPQGVQ